jgi:tetratricopeptide (TPR) repeat protein
MTASQENRARKNLLYRRLGIEKIKEMPDDAQAHFELGLVELDNFANLEGALELFRKTRLLNSRFQQAWFFEGVTLARLERFSEAIVCLRQSEKAGLRTALVAEVLGDTYYNLGKFDDSARMFRISLTRSKDHLRVESKLGLALVRDGQSKSGLEHLKNAVLCAPADPELHDRLLQAFVSLNQFDNAAAVADSKLEATLQPASADFLRAAALWFQLGRLARSAAILEVGLQMYPREETLRKGLEQLARHNSD